MIRKLFVHRTLMTPIASYVGFGAMIYGAHELFTGAVSTLWILPMLICTFFMLMGVTVGMHRLFCHVSFDTNKFWRTWLAVWGTLAIYGSTVQWPSMHATHHKYSDTDRDPHYTGWEYLFWKKNRKTSFHKRTLTRLYRSALHRYLHQYYALVVACVVFPLALVSPTALVFCYLIPLGWLHFVGSAHQVFAHGSDGPRDLSFMEFLLFTGGEWLHGFHHARPRSIRFGRFDLGYHFIRLIRRRPAEAEL